MQFCGVMPPHTPSLRRSEAIQTVTAETVWIASSQGLLAMTAEGAAPGLKRAHRKIPQPQIRVAAFFPDAEQGPVQGLAQHVVALAHGDADAFAEEAALDEGAAGEGAAIAGIGAVDPERQRDGIAEDEIDLALAERGAQRI